MSYHRHFIFPVWALIVLFFGWQSAFACACEEGDDTVLGNFEQAKFVIIAKAVSVETGSKIETYYSGGEEINETKTIVKSIKMIVEKIYKGNLKVGEEMIFGQGDECLWDFDEDAVGVEFLLYLDAKDKTGKLWFVNHCSRSTNVPVQSYRWTGNAADDLLFLDNIEKARGRTRISGSVFAYLTSPFKGEVNSYKEFADLKISINGNGKTYETTTNKDGVYEIYDLPAGNYTIQPEIPKNWKIDIWGGFATSSGNRREHENLRVSLEPRKHAFYDFHLELENKIRGKISDSAGKPIEDVCAQLFPAEGEPAEDFVRSRTACAKKDGSFEIKEIPPGNYKIVVNKENKISSRYPFNTVYYPNTSRIENASVIAVAEGEDKEGIDIRVPETKELITLNGVFSTSDGVPVANAWVSFNAVKTGENIEGSAGERTDENGKFSIKILKGLEGKLSGGVTLNETQFKDCPQIIKMIDAKGNIDWRNEMSDIIEIKADKNFDNVKLKLSFPSCNKQKIISRIKVYM